MRYWLFILALIAILLGSCGGSNSNEWRQKLTVTVEIDGQTYVGSSVSKMRAKGAGRLAYESRGVAVDEDFEGEAVVINLGEHGYLFALWKYQNPGGWTRSLKSKPKYEPNYEKSIDKNDAYYSSFKNGNGKRLNPGFPPSDAGEYPMLIAFKTINDPRTIQVFRKSIYLERRKRDVFTYDPLAFAKFFGGDAKITSITFEITNDPVTQGNLLRVLGSDYFEKWHEQIKRYKHPAECIDRTNNRSFCAQHKGMWIGKFSGEKK